MPDSKVAVPSIADAWKDLSMNADARTSGDELRLARLLLPELAERLDTVVGATDAARAEREFDDWLDAESDRLGERFSTAAFAELDAEASARFSAAFRRARALAERVGIEAPEPEALIEAGLDPAALADAIAEDPTLEAVLAPYGLGDLAWRELFRSAGASGAAGGLVLATEVVREFGRLDAVPDPSTPRVAVAGTDGGRIEWTLRALASELVTGDRLGERGLGAASLADQEHRCAAAERGQGLLDDRTHLLRAQQTAAQLGPRAAQPQSAEFGEDGVAHRGVPEPLLPRAVGGGGVQLRDAFALVRCEFPAARDGPCDDAGALVGASRIEPLGAHGVDDGAQDRGAAVERVVRQWADRRIREQGVPHGQQGVAGGRGRTEFVGEGRRRGDARRRGAEPAQIRTQRASGAHQIVVRGSELKKCGISIKRQHSATISVEFWASLRQGR
ncbi:hypothetical protein BMH30_08480 [Leucobacter sp. OLES1]|nr:hypothetical protein BMH30_08480 [Leucobacter sp. OLES1]